MEWIEFDGEKYPAYEAEGYAAQFIFPFAKKFCLGYGFDIGCSKEEWAFPGAEPIDLNFDDEWHATHLPWFGADYIFSSHCLEHIPDWVGALEYWAGTIRPGGTLFLYLPHSDQKYWRPWNNRKHLHVLTAEMVSACLESLGFKNILTTGRDLNHSFAVVAER